MSRRYKGMYRSNVFGNSSTKIEGTIYNPFPEIDTNELRRGVKRSYYSPLSGGLFLPPDDNGNLHALLEHEITHEPVPKFLSQLRG